MNLGRCLGCYQDLAEGIYHPKCSKSLFGAATPPELATTIEEMEQLAFRFLKERLTLPGVQRKLSLGIAGKDPKRLTLLGGLGGNFTLKPSSPEYEQLPENEDLVMHLAKVCGLKIAPHGLIPMGDGSLAYVTKRFDRKGKAKIAVEDLCQLSELLTEQKYRSSHEQVGKMIRRYSSVPGDDVLRFFELLVFSFVVGNSDMHLKNFSFITENADKVRLSPAYDLLSVRLVISAKEDPEELALSLNGKKSKLSRKDFEVCAASLKISPKVCSMVLQKQIGAMPAMKALVDRSFLHQKNRGHLKAIITENIAKLKVMS